MRVSIEGLIICETMVGDSDKYLTVLTREGKISIYAGHVRNLLRGSLVYAIPMQYCRFIVNKKSDKYYLVEGDVLHSFLDLFDDLEKYTLGYYIMDIIRELTVENSDESAMLSLALNTLFVIQKGEKPRALIKATFEFRAMAQAGYMPDLYSCSFCGKENGEMYLDIMNGRMICPECQSIRNAGEALPEDTGAAMIMVHMTPSVLKGLRYVLSASAKRLFSYSIAEDELDLYADVCEKYTLNHLERGFNSLDFYKSVIALPK